MVNSNNNSFDNYGSLKTCRSDSDEHSNLEDQLPLRQNTNDVLFDPQAFASDSHILTQNIVADTQISDQQKKEAPGQWCANSPNNPAPKNSPSVSALPPLSNNPHNLIPKELFGSNTQFRMNDDSSRKGHCNLEISKDWSRGREQQARCVGNQNRQAPTYKELLDNNQQIHSQQNQFPGVNQERVSPEDHNSQSFSKELSNFQSILSPRLSFRDPNNYTPREPPSEEVDDSLNESSFQDRNDNENWTQDNLMGGYEQSDLSIYQQENDNVIRGSASHGSYLVERSSLMIKHNVVHHPSMSNYYLPLSKDNCLHDNSVNRLNNSIGGESSTPPPSHYGVANNFPPFSQPANQFNNSKNFNKRTSKWAKPESNQPTQIGRRPFGTLSFDSAKIINIINKHSKESENKVAADEYSLSDSEFIRFGDLIPKNKSPPLTGSNNIGDIDSALEKLADIYANLIGVFGRSKALFQALADNSFIHQSEIPLYENHFVKSGSGLYLIPMSSENEETLILLILYSNDDGDFDEVNGKRSFVLLLRYLTQLCSTNILAIDSRDVALISFEENKKPQNFFVYKSRAKITADKCEMVEGSLMDHMTEPKNLIATSSRSGFYTKFSYNSTIEIVEDVHQWKSNDDYNKTFKGCFVTIDALESIETETMHCFLNKHFNGKNQLFESDVLRGKENKEAIEQGIEADIEFTAILWALKCIRYNEVPEYEWLESAWRQKRGVSTTEFSEIFNFLDKDLDLTDSVKFLFISIHKKIFESHLLETEKICINRILEEKNKSGASSKSQWDAQRMTPVNLEQYKPEVYNQVISKLNNNCHIWGVKSNWNNDSLAVQINKIKREKKFFDENSETCMEDALKLFGLCYKNVKASYKFQEIEKNIREKCYKLFDAQATKKLVFQIVKKCLERKEGKLAVNISDLRKDPISNAFELKYSKENVIEGCNEYSVFEYKAEKLKLVNAIQNDHLALCPTNTRVISFQLPKSTELLKVIFMKEKKLAIVVSSQEGSEMRFYDTSCNNEAPFQVHSFSQAINKVDYNESKRKIVFYAKKEKQENINVYEIRDDLNLINEAIIDLAKEFAITDINCLCLGNNNEVFLSDGQNNLWSVDYKNQTVKKLDVVVTKLKSILLVPEKDCLLFITSMSVVPYIIETGKTLPKISLDAGTNLSNLVITKFDSQVHLLFEYGGEVRSKLLRCELCNESYELIGCNPEENKSSSQNLKRKSVFDYFEFIYTQFSVYGPIKGLNKRSIEQHLIIYCSHTTVNNQKEQDKVKKKLKEIQDNNKKLHAEKLGLFENVEFIPARKDHSESLYSSSNVKALGRWMQELISLIPIQISRTDNNQYIILQEGKPLQLPNPPKVYDITEKISYGLAETILQNWDKPVKVISFISQQGCENSHALNHLCGTTFAIEPRQCNNGCWLTLKITNECLYVLLNVEGFGGCERSEHEDILLIMQTAALSSVTFYKTTFSHHNVSDRMLYRLNQAAKLVKDDKKIFKGSFFSLVENVDQKDEEEITTEFKEKVKDIIESGEGMDFITKIYNGECGIFTLDFFRSQQYEHQMGKLAQYIQQDVAPRFSNGKCVLDLLKVIQAKLAIEDYTSFSQQEIDLRIEFLKKSYMITLMFGNLADPRGSTKKNILKSCDDSKKIINEETKVEVKDPHGIIHSILYNDSDINMMLDSSNFIDVFNQGFPKTEENHVVWSILFRDFVKTAVKRRTARVLQWIDINLEKWRKVKEFQKLIIDFKQAVTDKAEEVETNYQICLSNCSSCFAGCTLLNHHSGAHSCGLADHKCKNVCTSCKEKNITQHCSLDFGHKESHACSDFCHTCNLKFKDHLFPGMCTRMITAKIFPFP